MVVTGQRSGNTAQATAGIRTIMRHTPFATLYILPAALSFALAVYGLRRSNRTGAVPFSLLMFSLAVWSLCHAFSVDSDTFAATLFWSQAQYAGIVSVGPFWLLFAFAYAGREAWANTAVRITMSVVAVLSFAAVLTNDLHHLWWTSVRLDTTQPFGALAVTRGPLFWTHAVIAYGYLLFGIGLFINRALGTSRFYQRQARPVILGVSIPLIGNIVELAGIDVPFADDPTPFLLLASGALLFYASSRYQLLDLAPIAQREVFESIPDGVIVIDRSGTVTSLNHSAQQFLPKHQHPAIGQAVGILFADSPLALDIDHMLRHSAEPQSRPVSYTDERGLHSVEIRLQPLFERSGGRAGEILILRDTTDRARAEQARDQRLREVSLLQQIARTANSAIQTDEVLRLMTSDILHSFGWQRVVIGLLQQDNTTLRLVSDQYEIGTSSLEGRFVDKYSFGVVIDLARAGQPRLLHVTDPLISGSMTGLALERMGLHTVLFLPLISRNQPLGMLFVGSTGERSINNDELRMFETMGKLISDAIVRAQLFESAQEASALKSAFLATVSHELRTPLTSVIGFADMLRSGVFGPVTEASDEAVAHIQHSSYVLLRLINDVLDYSKMEAGHFAVDIYPVDIGLCVQMAAGALRPQLHDRGLSLNLQLADDLPLVQANSARLEQVLMNLIGNAIKFTENGTITIEAAVYGPKLRLHIRDTGIGIPQEYQHSVFDAFRQIENPLTRRFGGTGLGLAITKRLMELMGGQIWLESQPSVGTTFTCEFHIAVVDSLPKSVPDEQTAEWHVTEDLDLRPQ